MPVRPPPDPRRPVNGDPRFEVRQDLGPALGAPPPPLHAPGGGRSRPQAGEIGGQPMYRASGQRFG
eukprot:3698785-Lingulodinium_polyedra.AAC.1